MFVGQFLKEEAIPGLCGPRGLTGAEQMQGWGCRPETEGLAGPLQGTPGPAGAIPAAPTPSMTSYWAEGFVCCRRGFQAGPQSHPSSGLPTPNSLPPGPDQLVCDVVHDVGIVEAAALVWPPALDVDAGLALQVGQMEVVPGWEEVGAEDWGLGRREGPAVR